MNGTTEGQRNVRVMDLIDIFLRLSDVNYPWEYCATRLWHPAMLLVVGVTHDHEKVVSG